MVTGIFLVIYAVIIIVLGVTECLYWVYTGIGHIECVDSIIKILLGRLFSTDTIPLFIHRHVHISNGRNTWQDKKTCAKL